MTYRFNFAKIPKLMDQDMLEKLKNEIQTSAWLHLKPHAERDHVIIVQNTLELVEVGVAVVANDTDSIEKWITAGAVNKPSAEQLATWNQHPAKEFKFLIAQPWVLVQEFQLN